MRTYVHFGNIASSNQLQLSAVERKRVQREHDAICFEMEARGVMNEYPCVVVRGIHLRLRRLAQEQGLAELRGNYGSSIR